MIRALLLASRALDEVVVRSLSAAATHVTLAQYRLLLVLAAQSPRTPSGVAVELGVAPSSVTRLSDRLVESGLISREAAPANRRQVLLSVSRAGLRAVEAITASRHQQIGALVAAVPAARRKSLIHALNDLSAAAGQVPKDVWVMTGLLS